MTVSCDNCGRIIDTEYVELYTPTVFGDIGFDGNLCAGCKSIIEVCIYHYSELYDQLTKKILSKMFKLNIKTQKRMR
ncbi:MAG: hypothetical protein ISR80_05930 [Nitrosopumilus sp.]|nr:hypothetical protein [Nitrosopumilus sp.]